MSSAADANKAVLVRMIEIFATGDAAAASDVVADTYKDHQAPTGGHLQGEAALITVVAAARKDFATLCVDVKDLISEGDLAAAKIRWHGELHTGGSCRSGKHRYCSCQRRTSSRALGCRILVAIDPSTSTLIAIGCRIRCNVRGAARGLLWSSLGRIFFGSRAP